MTASPHDSVDECMEKMLVKDIRHLPLLDDDGNVIGMLSVSSFVNNLFIGSALLKEFECTNEWLSSFFSHIFNRSRIW